MSWHNGTWQGETFCLTGTRLKYGLKCVNVPYNIKLYTGLHDALARERRYIRPRAYDTGCGAPASLAVRVMGLILLLVGAAFIGCCVVCANESPYSPTVIFRSNFTEPPWVAIYHVSARSTCLHRLR